MKVDDYLRDMKETTRRLSQLFNDPQPGIGSWHICVGREMDDLLTLWLGEDLAAEVKQRTLVL